MPSSHDPREGCRHDRAPLKRLGKVRHERTAKCVYVLLCTECGFTVTTDQLRRLRQAAQAMAMDRMPARG
jgi:hypothetical protein